MKLIQANFTGEDFGDMGNNDIIKAPQPAGMSRLHLAVGTVAGYDDCACLFHVVLFSLLLLF
jgi:hypothetical protein